MLDSEQSSKNFSSSQSSQADKDPIIMASSLKDASQMELESLSQSNYNLQLAESSKSKTAILSPKIKVKSAIVSP